MEGHDNDVQTIKIKEKMLEDQNATIRNLKQNLENKIREHAMFVEDNSKIEDKFREELKRISRLSTELQHELEDAENTIEGLQNDRILCLRRKNVRAAAGRGFGEIESENESIAHIEVEVEKVKQSFKRKEEKLTSENEFLLRSQDSLKKDMQQMIDLNMMKYETWRRRRRLW
ncbi:hypothetical protein BC829DRAFT_65729 [Chytridium lagenaria]|nr:hypothetical protein BC829DRAFT_65729 [Chytridium lagenaria]